MNNYRPFTPDTIETIRALRGMSISKLADQAGIMRGTYYRFLDGGNMTTANLEAICAALNIEIVIHIP